MDGRNKSIFLKEFFKRTLRALFSHLGLVFLVIIFTISGGFIFQLLEKHASIQKCEEGEGKYKALVKKLATTIFDYVWLNTTNIGSYSKTSNRAWINKLIEKEKIFLDNYNKDIPAMLKEYRKNVIEIYSTYKYSGQNCIEDTSWILESSLLFTLSVLTTIGYGHITPITWEGMIVCICFSMIGIPLCLLCLSKLSGDLADAFRSLFSSMIFYIRERYLGKNHSQNKAKIKPDKIDLNMFSIESLHFIKNSVENDLDSEPESDDSEEDNSEKKVSVPLFIVTIIIFVYVLAGSIMFKNLEGWSLIKSTYFSFITMSTIGFGDIVPGIEHFEKMENKNTVNRNLLIAGIYLFVGIAILAVCFDLLQETFIIKMLKISQTVKSEGISEIKRIEMRVKKIKPMIMKKSNDMTIQL